MTEMAAKEVSEKWGITPRQVHFLCAKGRVFGAVRFGHAWFIPADTPKPKDRRAVSKHRDSDENNGELLKNGNN